MKYLIAILLFFSGIQIGIAQTNVIQKKEEVKKELVNSDIYFPGSALFPKKDFSLMLQTNHEIPTNLVFKQYGFFCRNEINMQKKTIIPVKFRLGTLDYVNQLEYKR